MPTAGHNFDDADVICLDSDDDGDDIDVGGPEPVAKVSHTVDEFSW